MPKDKPHTPRQYLGVMVSSTFADLERHRSALLEALRKEGLFAIGMEDYISGPGASVISASLRMVRDASAYIAIISHRCGQVIDCPERNPEGYSICRMEFEEAQRLGLPTLVFVMGDEHDVKPANTERDPERLQKLNAYRERAKQGRIYRVFNSLEEFTRLAIHEVAELRRGLDEAAAPPAAPPNPADVTDPTQPQADPIPTPPAFYAEPPYIGSHRFVGRQAQLDTLADWAGPADPHPVLLFEAIGGTGKSMLTWEWSRNRAAGARADWAGFFWYSFYEKGAVMADFCRRALAYMTGQPLEELRKLKTPELTKLLLHQLQARPWLLVLDGLERVLVAYHRYDAAQVADEDAGGPDPMTQRRDPCAAIRPEDDDLLRALAGAAPSKLLLTTRLTPKVLLNPSGLPINGVRRETLPGLRPTDAEALFRACGVTGSSLAMQDFLQRHCDCHPLVTGVLAGLVANYLPKRGDFDAWAADPAGGGALNLADLDLVQKRNHILHAALEALPEKSRQLLSTLALLSEAVDYETLSALNPHLPPLPEAVEKPGNPEGSRRWRLASEEAKQEVRQVYQAALQRYREYEQALATLLKSREYRTAPQELAKTVRDLERRGLLQYDAQSARHDLHPVVRAVAAGGLRPEEKEQYGQKVVDHFSSRPHSPYEQAETLEDVRDGLHVVRTLLQMGRYQPACDAFLGDLAAALSFNLEAHAEVLSLLRPFFSHGWGLLPEGVDHHNGAVLANQAAIALRWTGELGAASALESAVLLAGVHAESWNEVCIRLTNAAFTLIDQGRRAEGEHCLLLALDLVVLAEYDEVLFAARLGRFAQLTETGRWTEAEATWQLLDPMGRDWHRNLYRPGDAELWYAVFRFYRGDLTEEHLARAEQLAREGRNRARIRSLHWLRGEWRLRQMEWALAAESFREAVHLAREVGQTDVRAETRLALARFHLEELPEARREAEQLSKARNPHHLSLAELWQALGDTERAREHALQAYQWACGEGEPYVRRYYLDQARALLEELGAEVPPVPVYDPARDEKLPWEDEVVAAIEKLRAEKEAEGQEEEDEE